MQRHELDRILTRILQVHDEASSLNFTVGRPPQIEVRGQLIPVVTDPPLPRLTPFQTEAIALALLGRDRRLTQTLVQTGSCDLPCALGSAARFRVNVFQQRNCYSIVLRRLASEIPRLDTMGLPSVLGRMAEECDGLILVAGAAGSGKSTTLAAILTIINETKAVHVVTLEDPVEFVHPARQATFNQRELGTDFDTFASGLQAALRQAPKVIVVGEMRDRDTMEIGLSAVESGHLVISTLRTVDAGSTINRVLGMFDRHEERQARIRLAGALRWVVSQRLLPKVGGGRVAALEIMGMNLRIEEIILNGESEGKTFYEVIHDSEALGMQTFDYHILRLLQGGQITEETALSFASRRSVVAQGLDSAKATRGQRISDVEGPSHGLDFAKQQAQAGQPAHPGTSKR